MSDLCKNCDTPVSGKYCCNCGQSFTTGRINYHYVIHEVQHSIFHVDKGILYTIKELLTEPGDSIRGYLSGKRISFFKPFSFVIILGSIYAFLCYFFGVRPDTSIMPVDQSEMTVYHTQLIIDWVYAHYSFALLALIPFFALGSYLVFRKSGYNYIELLVMRINISFYLNQYFVNFFRFCNLQNAIY
jgi:hypothetical protein